MSEEINYDVDSIQFSTFNPQEIRDMSVVEVTNPDTYDEDGVPVPRGVMDRRFGSQEPYQVCPVCGNTEAFCPGHFGHIELAEPVLHVVFIYEIKGVLQAVCRVCGRVKYSEEEKEEVMERIERLKGTRDEKLEKVYKSVIRKARKKDACPHCDAQAQKVDFQRPYTFNLIDEEGRANRLYPNEVREIFERIPDDDLPLLGFDPEKSRPEWLVLEVLPVPPHTVRPSTQLEAGMRSEDDLTHKLVDVVKVNRKVKESKEAGSPAIIVRDTADLLQYHVSTYFDNTITGVPPARHRSGRQLRTLSQRLSGKDGRFRTNLVGKRVDFSARTVISPDSNLDINEVGVPEEIATKLTVPERITEINLDEMKQLVKRGPNIHPGANYLIRPDGRRIYLEYVPDREALADGLEPGYVVERHIRDGDIVLFNRQPSLHRMSIMAHFVKVLPYRTFRLHLAVCPPYNADFDGDEMNLHVLQNEEAMAEAKALMRVQKQIISPRYGAPIIGMGIDHITSAYLLTQDDTRLTRNEFFKLLAAIDYDGEIPEPVEEEPEPLYSGKQAFSMLLPEDFTYSLRSAVGEKVVVKEGELVEGIIDEASIGAEKADSILHRIAREYGSDFTGTFLTKLTKLLDRFLAMWGFTISAEDLVVPDAAYEKIDETLEEGREKTDDLIEKYEGGTLEAVRGYSIEESLELKVMDVLSKARDEAGKTALDSMPDDSSLSIMTVSGARGSSLNVAQLSAVLGQQSIRGERIKKGFGDRTLSVFGPGDVGAEARGFVFSNFLKGLSPTEFYFHAMAGREGLIDTAVRTQQSGYMQRRLVNSLEQLKVSHDLTVRTYGGKIVQFKYGEDGVDPARSDHGKPVNVDRLVDSVSLLHPGGRKVGKKRIEDTVEKVSSEIPQSLQTELLGKLKENGVNKQVLEESVRQAVVNYKKSQVDPGAASGVIAAESIGEPGTQMTLRTFHFAGVRERDVTLGLPRIIEVVDARKNPSTPAMTIYLEEEYREDQEFAEQLANRIVETTLGDLVVESSLDLINGEVVFELSRDVLDAKGLTAEQLIEGRLSRYKVSGEGETLRAKAKDNSMEELQKLKNKLLDRRVSGIKDISQITVNLEGGEWLLYTRGTNLGDVLKMPEVDATRTTTNDLYEIADVLGIEATRNAIIEELRSVLEEQGLDVDIRHLMLIADLMTRTGELRGATRYGIVKEKDSVLARAAFEVTLPVLRKAAVRGQVDELKGAVENLIVGTRIPAGTGMVDVFMESR